MDQRLATGTLVDRYIVLDWLGEGPAGDVYASYDPKLDRKVVLKLLSTSGEMRDREALLEEARGMAKLAHPNVVRVQGTGTFEGRLFLVMEFVDGPNLRAWLKRDKPGLKPLLLAYVQAGRGLAAAHAAGVVHGDFKPENVLIGKDGRARMTDFGLAGAGHASDPLEDQLAFCRALHEVLLGDDPAVHAVPRYVRRVLERGLDPNPKRRYLSMDALLSDLTGAPIKRLQRILVVAAVAAALAGALFLWQGRATKLPPVCRDADRKLSGIWDPERKAQLERVFLATEKPFAADAWHGTEAALDTYAREWAAQFGDTCNTARGASSTPELFDLRMACLHERLEEMRALTGLFAQADGPVVARALSASQRLSRLAACSDVKMLTARIKPPKDPEIASKVDDLRQQLAVLKAMTGAAKYPEALPLAKRAAEEAEGTRYMAIQGEALLTYGELQGRMGDLDGCSTTLYRAASIADQAGDDRTRARIWSALLYYVGSSRGQFDKIPLFRDQATAAIDRLGGDDELSAELFNCLGAANRQTRELVAARSAFEQALSRIEKVYGPESQQAAVVTSNLSNVDYALGALDLALKGHQRALSIGEKTLGGKHPLVANMHSGIGLDQLEAMNLAESEAALRRSIEIKEALLGREHLDLLSALNGLGFTLVTAGKYAEALPYFERSLAMSDLPERQEHPDLYYALWDTAEAHLGLGQNARALELLERAMKIRNLGSHLDAAETEFALARALTGLGRDPQRAHTLAREAYEAFRKEASSAREKWALARMEAWMQSHRIGAERATR